MIRFAALATLLLCLLLPSTAMSGPLAKEVEVNGVRLQYVEHGSGEPIVFVHGASQVPRLGAVAPCSVRFEA